MTAKNTAEKSQTQAKQQQSLKGALATALQNIQPPTPNSLRRSSSEASKQPEKKPFEVSEEDLRKVLKGES